MKKILIGLLLISQVGFTQSKQETIDWLNQKFKENTDPYMGEYSIKINNQIDWGETLIITKRIKNAYMGESFEYYSFLPKNISSVITTSKYRNDGKLGLLITAKGENIYVNSEHFTSEIEILCIPAPDESIRRMQKGIIHLLNMMGNPIKSQKELFTN